MCFGPSINPAAGAAYGGFGGSPWLPFLVNLLSSYGQQQPQANAGQPSQSAQPTAPPPSAPPPAGMTKLTDPLAPTATPSWNVAPVAPSTPMPIAPPARDPFGSSNVAAVPVAGPGALTPVPFRPAFAGLLSPWAGLLGS